MPNFFGNPNGLPYYATTDGHLVVVRASGCKRLPSTRYVPQTRTNRVLWTQSLTDPFVSPYNFGGVTFPQMQLPWGGRRTVMKLQNQFLGNVGPCTDNGVCIQQGHEVMCLDSITGKVQWVRHGVPPGSEIFGDDEITLLAPPPESPGGGNALVLRTIDGELLGKRPVAAGRTALDHRRSLRSHLAQHRGQQSADRIERSLDAARCLVANGRSRF